MNKQIILATFGIEKPILELQTATGVKDKIAQHWIDILVTHARQMKSNEPGRTSESISAELLSWFHAQPGDKINPLLLVPG